MIFADIDAELAVEQSLCAADDLDGQNRLSDAVRRINRASAELLRARVMIGDIRKRRCEAMTKLTHEQMLTARRESKEARDI